MPADVGVLSGDEKLLRQASSLGETLDYMPGISNIGTGTGVGKPVIRGLSGNRIRVLQDGIGVDYQQFGVRHPPNLDPFLAERVEVVRGTASLLYGSDAFGGAINVLSPVIDYADDEKRTTQLAAMYRREGAHDLHVGGVHFGAASGRVGVAGGLVYRDAGRLEVPDVEVWNGPPPGDQPSDIPRFSGELDYTDFEQLNATIKGGYRFDGGELGLRYENWRHENNYLLPTGAGIGIDLENHLVQARFQGELASLGSIQGSYTWTENRRLANPAGRPLPVSDPAIELERDSHTLRVELARGNPFRGASGTLGVEARLEDQTSRGPTGLSPGGQIDNVALFGLGRWLEGPWTVEGGLRFDHRSQEADPSQTRDPGLLVNRIDPVSGERIVADLDHDYSVLTASMGLLRRFGESFAVAANLNRGFRAPELFELYASGVHGGVAAIQFGDPTLDAETSVGGDVQARWRSQFLDLTVTAYRTVFSDYIFLADSGVTDSASGLPVFTVDQADASMTGGDIAASYRAAAWLTVEGVYEVVRGEFDAGGDDVPLLPADSARLEAILHGGTFGIVDRWDVRIGMRHAWGKDAAGSREPFSQFDRNPNFGTASTDSYTLYDLGVTLSIDRLRVDLLVQNATDEAYRDFLDTYKGYALSPGRNVVLQARWSHGAD